RSNVVAFDIATGAERWRFPVGNGTDVTGLAVSNGLVFATDVLKHAVFAIDAVTGQQVWRLPSTVGTTGPVIIGDTLIYNDNVMRAVDAQTGDPLWSNSVFTFSTPAIDGKTLYVVYGSLYAIDPQTGSVLWTFLTETDS